MFTGPRVRLFCLAVLGAAALSLGGAYAADKDKEKDKDKGTNVQFDSADGVELDGTLYTPPQGVEKKEASVILLHDVDPKLKNDDSQATGWDDLAKALAADGYTVLTFSFRGYGHSTSVKKEFWENRYNSTEYLKIPNFNPLKPPDTISRDMYKNKSEYYPYLVNDIAAAKAFLDRKNDGGLGNTSSVIVIGAGEGATLGALWMEAEWHRQKVTLDPNGPLGMKFDVKTRKFDMDEPEGRDLAAGVWLNISPKLAGRSIPSSIKLVMEDVTGENKVPMLFLYGDKDDEGEQFAKRNLKYVEEKIRSDNNTLTADALDAKVKERMKFVLGAKIDGGAALTGSKLLESSPAVSKLIIEQYLQPLYEKRGPKERRARENDKNRFLWTFPGMDVRSPAAEAKREGKDAPTAPPPAAVIRGAGG
jgi:pimeloyl-ACP methyl ester carboxylesterase